MPLLSVQMCVDQCQLFYYAIENRVHPQTVVRLRHVVSYYMYLYNIIYIYIEIEHLQRDISIPAYKSFCELHPDSHLGRLEIHSVEEHPICYAIICSNAIKNGHNNMY